MVKLLLDNGAPVDSQLNTQVTDWKGIYKLMLPEPRPSVVLLKRGNAEIARLLIARGADMNHADNQGVTPLMKAAREEVSRL